MSSGNDTITGTSGADIIDAGEGDDIVNALGGNDTITGGKGNDILNGGAGNDTYNYIRGDGNDTITELSLGGSSDRLVFTGINQADVTLVRNGTDVMLVIAESAPGAGDGGSILLKDNFEDVTDRGIDRIVFADNSSWTRASLRAAWLAQVSTSGNDTITGFNTADTITGGAGNDIMDGGKGNDIYNYARGHGNDTIIEAASGGTDDRLVLQGINPSAVSLVRNGNDVTLVITESTPGAGDGGSVLLKDNFEDYYDQGVDKIVFGDGTIWTRAALRTAFLAQSSTSGNDVITGFAVNDTINAGAGNDQIFAGDGADMLTGGKGTDSLYGGAGNDTYIYARGDGNDTIQEDSGGGPDDRLVLTGINPADVTLVRIGNDASLVIAESASGAGDGGSILLKANFDEDNGQGVDKIVFADGTIWTRAELRAMYLAHASTAADDTIAGFAGVDTINAGAGNDVINAGAGNDDLRGGAGNDTLSGGDGSDTYRYARGDGNDTIIEGVSGGVDDRLVLDGINRSDVIVVRNGNDVIIFIAESAPGAGDGGSILLKDNVGPYPNSGVEGIVFADGTTWSRNDLLANVDYVGGTPGNDTITGTSGNDLVRAGKGNDTLLGGGGNDEYHYQRGDGTDTIIDEASGGVDDRLVLEAINPANVSLVRNGNDLTVVIAESAPGAGDGGSVLIKDTLDDDFYNSGIEKIVFADGTIWTRAQLRDMLLTSTSADETFVGFSGNDTYRYARGDGHDTISESRNGGNADQLLLTDINPSAVTLVRNGNDVTVVIAESAPGAGDGGWIVLKNSLDENYGQGVDKVVFADGTVWTPADIRVMLLDQASTSGNDTIAGFNTADTIRGAAGNDTLNGAGGDDIYLYARGEGNDTIFEGVNGGGNDRLVFSDINPSSVSLVRNGNDVTVVIAESTPGAGDGASIVLKDSLDENYGQGVDKIVFADGTIWTRADIRALLVSASGTSGDDTINGTGSSDIIAGHAGNDTLNGAGGDDTYLYARGDGHDTVVERQGEGGNDQLVFSDINPAAVSLVRNGNDVTVVIAESTPGAGDGGSVLLKDSLVDSWGLGVDKIAFADGTVWTRAQLRDMLLTSTSADEVLVGFSGDDTFRYARGDGHDTIVERQGEGSNDQLVFSDINPAAVSLVRNGNDVTVVIAESTPGAGDGGSVLLKDSLVDSWGLGVDKIAFADGTVWTRAQLRDMLLTSTSADEILVGFSGDDTFRYARGDGHDTIVERQGEGSNDQLVFSDINPAAVSLVRNGNDVTVVIAESTPGAGDGGSVLLKDSLVDSWGLGVDKIVFADGTIWTRAQLRDMLLTSTSADEVLVGFSGDDTFRYARGDGHDTIVERQGEGGNDQLVFSDINPAAVSLVRNGNDVTVVIAESTPGAGDGGSVLLKDSLVDSWGLGVDKIVFADGTIWTRSDMNAHISYVAGTAGNDTITGSAGNDDIRAGLGDDLLIGQTGNDTYTYILGDGNDVINEVTTGTDVDTLILGGINQTDVRFERPYNDWSDVVIRVLATGQTIRLDNQFDQKGGVEKIVFDNGSVLGGNDWSLDGVLTGLGAIYGTTNAETISGTSGDDRFVGLAGNDTLSGGTGSDTYLYSSGDGNDTINDNSGSTTDVDTLKLSNLNAGDVTFSLDGQNLRMSVNATGAIVTVQYQFYSTTANWGIEKVAFADGTEWDLATISANAWVRGTSGNDQMTLVSNGLTVSGGTGNDSFSYSGNGGHTFMFAKGDGNDTLTQTGSGYDRTDKLVLTDIDASEVGFMRSGDRLTISILGTDSVTSTYQYWGESRDGREYGIATIQFADGTIWDRAAINNHLGQYGTTGSDTLVGTASNERLSGFGGADTLQGAAGNDVLIGGAGADTLTGGADNDTFIFKAGFGLDTITDFTAGAASDDIIQFGNDVFADFASVLAAASQVGADTVITHDAGNTLTLKNVALANLHQDDFQFIAA
ncbi:calcium-binding protein [Mesorhizobium huakuii]|uniref:Calcium-binding protein n=1 Tax=Mesorhizobium huakuii TaxID=28104 RepID=A0ABZ0VQH7_9HYPH|nr:calcium-binding protein [Mesorhizobium huakuii]WQB99228.1 calcium-binding protein [Mesorhizobium huakuii]